MRALPLAILLVLCTAAASAGDVSGKVLFRGTPPKPFLLMMNADPKCMAQHKGPVYGEDVVVNPNGTLRNVLVAVKTGLPGRKFDPPGKSAVLDQKGCQYHPHVLGVMAGQEVEIVNEDPTLHNVHSVSKANPQFNIAQPRQGMKMSKRFEQAETFRVKCEVHPWMGAYIGVFMHPFFAVTGDDGSFTIRNLPPGDYTIEAWHERYGTRTLSVKVAGSGPATADFTYEAK